MRRPRRSLATLATLVGACILLGACSSGIATPAPTAGGSAKPPPPLGSTQPSAASSRAPYAGAALTIPLAPGPRGVAVAGGSVWVASTIGGVIQEIDPSAGEVKREIHAGPRPVTLVTSDGLLWANVLNGDLSNDDELVQLDPASGKVLARVTVPAFHNIAAGGGRIWSVDGSSTLYAVDPSTATIASVIPDGGITIAITADATAVWGIRADRQAWRVPIDGGERVEAPLGVAVPGRSRVAVGEERVFVAVPGSVLALDPRTLAVTARLDLSGLQLVNDLFVTDQDVWLSAHVTDPGLGLDGGSVLRLDPGTLEILATYRLGPESSGVVADDGRLWAVDQDDDLLAGWTLP